MIETLPFFGVFEETKMDSDPSWYIYEVETPISRYSGLVCSISLEESPNSCLLRHEEVFQNKVDCLQQEFIHMPLQKNPILLITDEVAFKQKLQKTRAQALLMKEAQGENGRVHRIFKIPISAEVRKFRRPFCVADGHHRLSAIARLKKRKAMAAIFSADQVTTRAKSIVLQIKNMEFWNILHEMFDVIPLSLPVMPTDDSQFTMLFQNQWYQICLKPFYLKQEKFRHLLGIEIFRETVLRSIFQISNYADTSHVQLFFEESNIDFLTKRISKNDGVGFIVSSDSFIKVIKAARTQRILEPNSTYFEPKLMSGLISFNLDNLDDN